MNVSAQRHKVHFSSGGTECAAWYYPGSNGGCVVMAGGAAVPKEPGTDRFAKRFNEAGFAVLAFDFRHLGESGGRPRQVIRIKEQLADWRAAIDFATAQPDTDPAKIALWGFSLSGGMLLQVAANDPRPAAVIAQSPLMDGPAAAVNASRHTTAVASLRLTGRALADALGGLLGRPPLLVPTAGEPGSLTILTTPDAMDGDRALDPDRQYRDWQQTVAARFALRIAVYRPGRQAPRVRCPMLVVVCDQDRSALPEPALKAAAQAPRAEVVRLPGGHYAPFLDGHEAAVAAELDFLRRHLLGAPAPSATPRSANVPSSSGS